MLCLGAGETFPNACVQQWFHRRRGRAVGCVFTFQWLGNAVYGTVIAGVVAQSWHLAAGLGAVANLALAPLSALLLRRNPEVCGLVPDGWAAVEDEEVKEELEERADARKFWAHFLFTFYALMFGGCDFYMLEMIAEASGTGAVSVSLHIFAPLAVASSMAVPTVGELMDGYSGHKRWLPSALLAVAGFLTGLVTLWLTSISGWFSAVSYGVARGITAGIFQSLLSAGLCFSTLGVGRNDIGRMLGYNQLSTLVGTGVGPLWYGTCRDIFGSFRFSLVVSSLPTMLLGLFFAHQALQISKEVPAASVAMAPVMVGSKEEA